MKKVFLLVLISIEIVNAQAPIGSFSVLENAVNGVPTVSTTSKFDLYTDRIIIYDKKVVTFFVTDLELIPVNKMDTYLFSFNHANCTLFVNDDNTYELNISTNKKKEIFYGYRNILDSSDSFSLSNPLEGVAVQDCTIDKSYKDLTQEEKSLNFVRSLKPIVDPDFNRADRIEVSDYTEEEKKFLKLGYTFAPGANINAMRGNEEAKTREKIEYVVFAIIAILVIGGIVFVINERKESLERADSKIKSVDENILKQNLSINNLDNTNITEIDDNTLKQKLGL